MPTISQAEADFILLAAANSTRMDGRRFDEARFTNISPSNPLESPMTDHSIDVCRENSHIVLSVTFRTSMNSLYALGKSESIKEAYKTDSFRTVELSIRAEGMSEVHISSIMPDISDVSVLYGLPPLKELEKQLDMHEIGCLIELYIKKDDGNIFDMLFEGLREMFYRMPIPNILNLEELQPGMFKLPISYTYAVNEGTALLDPTKLEEKGLTGILHVFSNGYMFGNGIPLAVRRSRSGSFSLDFVYNHTMNLLCEAKDKGNRDPYGL